jgi:hypothetical protein
MPQADQYRPAWNRLRRFFAVLGPGLITGAADDDPSAIGTYSVVGAQRGTTVLWTAFITWPLIAAIQMICACIGSGKVVVTSELLPFTSADKTSSKEFRRLKRYGVAHWLARQMAPHSSNS